jgi:hypothetical protein
MLVLNFVRRAINDGQQLLGLNSEDARTLIRVQAAEVHRLTPMEEDTFLRLVGAESLIAMPNPSQADAEAAMGRLLKDQPDTESLIARLRADREAPDGSYPGLCCVVRDRARAVRLLA